MYTLINNKERSHLSQCSYHNRGMALQLSYIFHISQQNTEGNKAWMVLDVSPDKG